MTLTLQLSDEQVSALEAKAAAAGLSSVEEWIERQAILPKSELSLHQPLQTAAQIMLDSMRDVPPELMANMPADGASQHDHYLHGWPKREVQ